jgi:hypothetical protein
MAAAPSGVQRAGAALAGRGRHTARPGQLQQGASPKTAPGAGAGAVAAAAAAGLISLPSLPPDRQMSIAFTIDEILASGEDPGLVPADLNPGAAPLRPLTTAEAAAAFAAGGAAGTAAATVRGRGGCAAAGEGGAAGLPRWPSIERQGTMNALYDADPGWLERLCSDSDTDAPPAGEGLGSAAAAAASAAANTSGPVALQGAGSVSGPIRGAPGLFVHTSTGLSGSAE